MVLKISGLNELRERLERLRPEEVMARALAEQAQRMAVRVQGGLSGLPGGTGHDEPWLGSGALRDSIGAQADGLQAAVGTSDPAGAPQEMGTVHMPPRPFLAPVAAEMGEEVARAVGVRVAAALRGEEGAEDSQPDVVQASSTGTDLVQTLPFAALAALLYALGRNAAPSRPGIAPNRPTVVETSPPEDKGDAPPTELAKPGEATPSEDRLDHIADLHEHGRNVPGKSEFPPGWTKDKIGKVVLDVANDPTSVREHADGDRTSVKGTRDGVDVIVIIGRDRKTIVTAFPVNTPQNGS